jgi:biopolymer transport protein ExbD
MRPCCRARSALAALLALTAVLAGSAAVPSVALAAGEGVSPGEEKQTPALPDRPHLAMDARGALRADDGAVTVHEALARLAVRTEEDAEAPVLLEVHPETPAARVLELLAGVELRPHGPIVFRVGERPPLRYPVPSPSELVRASATRRFVAATVGVKGALAVDWLPVGEAAQTKAEDVRGHLAPGPDDVVLLGVAGDASSGTLVGALSVLREAGFQRVLLRPRLLLGMLAAPRVRIMPAANAGRRGWHRPGDAAPAWTARALETDADLRRAVAALDRSLGEALARPIEHLDRRAGQVPPRRRDFPQVPEALRREPVDTRPRSLAARAVEMEHLATELYAATRALERFRQDGLALDVGRRLAREALWTPKRPGLEPGSLPDLAAGASTPALLAASASLLNAVRRNVRRIDVLDADWTAVETLSPRGSDEVGIPLLANELYPVDARGLSPFASVPGRHLPIAPPRESDDPRGWLFLDTWHVVGPFPNPERKNLDTAFGPWKDYLERWFQPPRAGEVPGKTWPRKRLPVPLGGPAFDPLARLARNDGRKVGWQFVQTNAEPVVPPDACRYGVWYAYTELFAPRAATALVLVGCGDHFGLWIEGDYIYESPKTPTPWLPGMDVVPVRLCKGVNRVLVRLENAGGATGFSVLAMEAPDLNLP